jgi:hypothetical protein
MNPTLISIPDDGLRSRADDEFLIELSLRIYYNAIAILASLKAIMGNNGTLLSKTLYVFCLTRKEALQDEQREISILNTRLLEHLVKLLIHLLPNRETVRLDDHTAANWGLLGQVGLYNQVVIPLTIIVSTLG